MRSIFCPAVLAAVLTFGSISARAQSEAEDRATARALAQQGSDALDSKDYAKAEDAFRRADALYHAPTLVLGLARAQAGEGKFVEAWESYNRIVLENVTSTPVFAKALEDAKREIASVGGRRSRITVTVAGPSSPRVMLDHAPLKNEALGVPLFVDPGAHAVQAGADGFLSETRTFSVDEGASRSVALALEPAPPAAPAPAAAPAQVLPIPAAPPPAPADSGVHRPNRTPAVAAFVVGGVGLVGGLLAGALALRDHGDLSRECPGGTCPPSSQPELDRYRAAGLVSTVAFVVAGVGAAAGTTLWLLENKSAGSAFAWVSPYVGIGSVGALGRF